MLLSTALSTQVGTALIFIHNLYFALFFFNLKTQGPFVATKTASQWTECTKGNNNDNIMRHFRYWKYFVNLLPKNIDTKNILIFRQTEAWSSWVFFKTSCVKCGIISLLMVAHMAYQCLRSWLMKNRSNVLRPWNGFLSIDFSVCVCVCVCMWLYFSSFWLLMGP